MDTLTQLWSERVTVLSAVARAARFIPGYVGLALLALVIRDMQEQIIGRVEGA